MCLYNLLVFRCYLFPVSVSLQLDKEVRHFIPFWALHFMCCVLLKLRADSCSCNLISGHVGLAECGWCLECTRRLHSSCRGFLLYVKHWSSTGPVMGLVLHRCLVFRHLVYMYLKISLHRSGSDLQ
jgi:hypothetical protein